MKRVLIIAGLLLSANCIFAQQNFNGLDMHLGNLYKLSDAQTRSISPENFTGEKGKGGMADPNMKGDKRNVANAHNAARELGQTWKVNPYIRIAPGETFTLAEIEGPGAIQHIWMTPTGNWRFSIIRFYWDGEEEPSVECPVGDFFAMGWGEYSQLSSLAVCVNPGSAFNCYWNMPFRRKCRITMENINPKDAMTLYYQIDYALTEIPQDAAYFHAQFRHTPSNETSDYVMVDGIKGQGQYVGTYMAYGIREKGWWGEGEIKFFIDGDTKFPTICGTGTEDYFCGSYNFERHGKYVEFCTPYSGLHQIVYADGTSRSQDRFGMYRWHVTDPVRFREDLKITMQDLGWQSGGRYLAQKSNISSVVYWYQTEPHAKFPTLPGWQVLELKK